MEKKGQTLNWFKHEKSFVTCAERIMGERELFYLNLVSLINIESEVKCNKIFILPKV